MKTEKHKTLGRNVIPLNYQIVFEPNMKIFKYRGTEIIKINIKKPTNKIRLNASELEISEAHAEIRSERISAKVKYNEKGQEIELSFPKQIAGTAELHFEFEGKNNDKLYGFYRSKYIYKGKEDHLLTSQFEAANARNAFPCFDEPEFKATFDVSFVIDNGLSAISNMPVKSEKKQGSGKKKVKFFTTPKMSSYLLYLAVGKFEFNSSEIGKLIVRLVTPPGKKEYSKMAMQFVKKFLPFYEEYFGIKYPLPKLDFIAIPDFAAGAMENWGAITFRESALLGDEKHTSVAVKQQIAVYISHELVHQWFGDLVTMKWWNDLWLNESFATFMGDKAIDAAYPEWEMLTQYVRDVIGTALAADQLNSTHPISVPVNDPGEIDQIFDEISYDKGGSVLNMIEDFIGERNFRRGLHKYLLSHSYGNATKYDFWKSMEKEPVNARGAVPVEKVASYWVDNAGYPVIQVRCKGEGKLELKQERYFLLEKRKDEKIWPIPLKYSVDGKSEFMLFESQSATIDPRFTDYIKLNASQKGVYRVDYQDLLLDRLGEQIKSKKLSAVDAWGVENDLYSFARSCRVPLTKYLNFIEKYCFDVDYPLNQSVSGHINSLVMLLYGKKSYEEIIRLSLKYHGCLLKKIGWKRKKDERNVITLLRGAAIASLGISGDKRTVKKAADIFKQIVEQKSEVDANIKSAVYRINAWNGDASTLSILKGMYEKDQMPDEKNRLLGSLGGFRDPRLLNLMLRFSLSKEVRYQDAMIIPLNVASNPIGKELIWSWTKTNWRELMKRNSSGGHMLGSYVDALGYLCDAKTFAEIKKFYSKKSNKREDIELTVKQALEIIELNIKFIKKNSE